MHRQIFLLVSVLLILIIGAVLLRLLLTNSGRASSESDDNTAQAKEDDDVINMQFENILDDDNAELTITWDEPIMKSTFEAINADILNCIESLASLAYYGSGILSVHIHIDILTVGLRRYVYSRTTIVSVRRKQPLRVHRKQPISVH